MRINNLFTQNTNTMDFDNFSAPTYTDATKGVRFANNFIDGIVISILFSIIRPILISEPTDPEDIGAMMAVMGVVIAAYLLMYFAYYVGMEASTGKTVGKYVTGTQVLTQDGEQPSGGTIFIRTLCRIIPFEPFSLLFNNYARGWHDNWSETRVVKTRKDDNDGGGVIR